MAFPISWSTVQSLLIFFGPMLLPKIIAWYRSVKNPSNKQAVPVRRLPTRALITILILFGASAVLLIKTLPIYSPENVFKITASQPESYTDLILSRLATVRPITPRDETLRTKFASKASRLMYFKFGPDTILDCPFCISDQPRTYIGYTMPALLTPHLLNLILVGLATSQPATGSQGAQWRTAATYVAVGLAFLDVYLLYAFDDNVNKTAHTLKEVDFFFWRLRSYRYAALAGLDNLLIVLLYYSTTNRAFHLPLTNSDRVEAVTRHLLNSKAQLHAAQIVKNTATRDEDLRGQSNGYWRHEVAVTQELMQDPEVMDGINDALQNKRIDMQAINSGAQTYVDTVLEQAKLGV